MHVFVTPNFTEIGLDQKPSRSQYSGLFQAQAVQATRLRIGNGARQGLKELRDHKREQYVSSMCCWMSESENGAKVKRRATSERGV